MWHWWTDKAALAPVRTPDIKIDFMNMIIGADLLSMYIINKKDLAKWLKVLNIFRWLQTLHVFNVWTSRSSITLKGDLFVCLFVYLFAKFGITETLPIRFCVWSYLLYCPIFLLQMPTKFNTIHLMSISLKKIKMICDP